MEYNYNCAYHLYHTLCLWLTTPPLPTITLFIPLPKKELAVPYVHTKHLFHISLSQSLSLKTYFEVNLKAAVGSSMQFCPL